MGRTRLCTLIQVASIAIQSKALSDSLLVLHLVSTAGCPRVIAHQV